MSEPSEISEALDTLDASESPEILSRADSLMMRRRSLSTPAKPAADTPQKADPPAEEDDLPILTEIVPVDVAIPAAQETEEDNDAPFAGPHEYPDELHEPDESLDETQASQLTAELAAEISRAFNERLADELPALLENVLDMAKRELRAGLDGIMAATLRDFMAHRKPPDLPPEGQNDEA